MWLNYIHFTLIHTVIFSLINWLLAIITSRDKVFADENFPYVNSTVKTVKFVSQEYLYIIQWTPTQSFIHTFTLCEYVACYCLWYNEFDCCRSEPVSLASWLTVVYAASVSTFMWVTYVRTYIHLHTCIYCDTSLKGHSSLRTQHKNLHNKDKFCWPNRTMLSTCFWMGKICYVRTYVHVTAKMAGPKVSVI